MEDYKMIRKYQTNDFDQIKNIINQCGASECAWLTTEEAIRSDVDNAKAAFVFDDGKIRGYTYMDKVDSSDTLKRVHIYIFVHPDFWWDGIAEKLWLEIKPYVEEENAYRATIAFPADHTELRVLFKMQGFKHYFYSLRLEYNGQKFEKQFIDARYYKDNDFEDYLRIFSKGFYNLRKEHDMQPYLIYSKEDYENEELRKKIYNEETKGCYTFLIDNQIVGFGKIDDYIDEVVVDQNHQGKGYGKSIVKYCTNVLIEKGKFPVAIYHLDTNFRARKMYEGLGFKVKAIIESLELVKSD